MIAHKRIELPRCMYTGHHQQREVYDIEQTCACIIYLYTGLSRSSPSSAIAWLPMCRWIEGRSIDMGHPQPQAIAVLHSVMQSGRTIAQTRTAWYYAQPAFYR